MSNSTKCYRFDVVGLSPERIKQFNERLDMAAFLVSSGSPKGKTVYFDVTFNTEPDLPTLLKGFEDVKYIDYTHVPFRDWKYPFS